MTAKVILNPYANRWKALAQQPEVETALQKAGIEYELVVSKEPRHIIQLAAEAAEQGFSPIIAAGGDGTIGEVVNGLAKAAPDAASWGPLGVMPLGTANDFVDNLGLPKGLAQAAQTITVGQTKPLDVGAVNGWYFVNNSALGLEPTVTLIQERLTWVKGIVRYLLATFIAIAQKPLWTMRLEWDDGNYEGLATLVTVGNNPRTGGLFYMTPHAEPDDGKLTFVYGIVPTRRRMLQLLPRTMKPGDGSYVEAPEVFEYHATWLRISATPPTPMHTDGEIYDRQAQELNYCILPGKLQVLY
jgi:diacylglycerol kinase (ATP)